jgi:chemotaxis protein MotA
MGSIDQPPAILGGMIGSALVGTFLGVLLAYGIVGPMASRLKQVLEQDEQIFHAVKQVIIASLHGHPQPLVVESARSGLGDAVRPRLTELLDSLRGR